MGDSPRNDTGGGAAPVASTQGESEEEKLRKLAEFEAKLKYISENVVHDASNVVFGSAAGAGSSTYHIYRRSRRNEEDRWRRVEAMDKEKKAEEEYQRKRKALEEMDKERLERNRAKRAKKKQKRKGKGAGTGGDKNDAGEGQGRGTSEQEAGAPSGGGAGPVGSDDGGSSEAEPDVPDLD